MPWFHGILRPNGQIEWFIPYTRIQKGLLERELQAAVVRLLTPRGTVSATSTED
ncbi:MAG: hypothetical protein JSR64_19975 [Nitrospira sp.]|nr:hypothetical protein [Nitrospira sp.]MBX3337210.1 hypothetical protein [Nitrospira sp.]MCW5780219.1 hypothetical protein [Nitrospira sp.]